MRNTFRLQIYLMFFLLASCSHKSTGLSSIPSFCDFDPTSNREKLAEAPFIKEFSKPNGRIIFIAAAHGEEPGNKTTFDLIRSSFDKFPFKMAIVEGLENAEGPSPEKYLNDIKTSRRKMDEPAFTALESQKRGIEFLGGEISDIELLQTIQQKGFSRRDMAGFYILRSWTRDSSLTLGRLIDSKRFPIDRQFSSSEDFQSWFMKIYGKDIPLSRDPKLSMPFQGRSDRLQQLANEITWARDRFLAKLIADSHSKKEDVLVVYGSGHYLTQKCFIEKW